MDDFADGWIKGFEASIRAKLGHWALYDRLFDEYRRRKGQPMGSSAAFDILMERDRQVKEEGWDEDHDDKYKNDELSRAASCYALNTLDHWPWMKVWWKPTTKRRNLVKAGALILAEIERLDRLSQAITDLEDSSDG